MVFVAKSLSPVVRDVKPNVPEDIIPPLLPEEKNRIEAGMLLSSQDFSVVLQNSDLARDNFRKEIRVEHCEQRVILAWNGKNDQDGEVLLIYTPIQQVTNGEGTVLSILPLPGKPISLSRTSPNTFQNFKSKLISKWDTSVATPVADYAQLNATIPVVCAFVLKIDNVADFYDDICQYLSAQWGSEIDVAADDFLTPLKHYFDRGFRYFSFDITKRNDSLSNKETLVYRFKSKAAFFPLHVGRIGGFGDTFVDMILISPRTNFTCSYQIGMIDNNFKTNNPEKIEVTLNGKPVVFSKTELNSLDENLGSFFEEDDFFHVQNVQILGPVCEFDKDFFCK